jgi:hypothetical protein
VFTYVKNIQTFVQLNALDCKATVNSEIYVYQCNDRVSSSCDFCVETIYIYMNFRICNGCVLLFVNTVSARNLDVVYGKFGVVRI